MTLVKIKKEYISGKDIITQINIKNHADFDKSGEDIVCAAISSSSELVINVLTENFLCVCETEITDDPPEILLKILASEFVGEENKKKSFAVAGLLDGFAAHLKNIELDYPENIEVTVYEVCQESQI